MNELKESSAVNRMQERYWTTKQAVFKKLGKKDDDCIIASDAELDAKLELFQTIEESFFTLMRVLENYQDKLCNLAQEENGLGRFLKENGKFDKTRAGKVMVASGKALSFNAQQKLTLRLPLVRLYHEVETFQYRAIVDTLQTVDRMEKARTAYRGALMWMKDISQQLDPDTSRQLEKFRKVQGNVRKTKIKFDKLKLDTLQKVDLLSFSRCNLFSQALAAYQNTLIEISKKMANTLTQVAETTKGYQHYEFSLLKELSETSKKLADETADLNGTSHSDGDSILETADKDVLLFFGSEYKDDDGNINSPTKTLDAVAKQTKKKDDMSKEQDDSLINVDLSDNAKDIASLLNPVSGTASKGTSDLLTGLPTPDDDTTKSDLELLNEILDTNRDFNFPDDNSTTTPQESNAGLFAAFQDSSRSCFLPSQLLDMGSGKAGVMAMDKTSNPPLTSSGPSNNNVPDGSKKENKQDMASWYNLFADLDPLANPDLVGKKPADDLDC